MKLEKSGIKSAVMTGSVVGIASSIGGFAFLIVLMFAIFAPQQMSSLGWVIIPLTAMGAILGIAGVAGQIIMKSMTEISEEQSE